MCVAIRQLKAIHLVQELCQHDSMAMSIVLRFECLRHTARTLIPRHYKKPPFKAEFKMVVENSGKSFSIEKEFSMNNVLSYLALSSPIPTKRPGRGVTTFKQRATSKPTAECVTCLRPAPELEKELTLSAPRSAALTV